MAYIDDPEAGSEPDFGPPGERILLDPISRLSRDLKLTGATLTDAQARYIVDTYYMMQEQRKRAYNQERALTATSENHELISWVGDRFEAFEEQIRGILDQYTQAHPMGNWMRSVYGIGPIISAGFLAFLYMGEWCSECHSHNPERCLQRQNDPKPKFRTPPHTYRPEFSCETVGHFWAYAGIAGDGQKPWLKGQKRPWNATLKVVCWRFGDVLVKFKNNPHCFYGHVYRDRKDLEVANNDHGLYKHIAAKRLQADLKYERENPGKVAKEKSYHEKGILSPGHLDLRARRVAVKLFLAHLHDEWYRRTTGNPPPLPYPIAHLNHAHVIQAPKPPEPTSPPLKAKRSRTKK